MMRRTKKPVGVSVDLGGTWLRVLALTGEGKRVFSLKAPAVPLASLPSALRKIWRRRRVTHHEVKVLVVASRGVWTVRERARHEKMLKRLAKRVRVIADVEAAYLGALGARPGILLLAGTGSIALGLDRRGRWMRRGGMGPLLGDEGSAFWIGREYLRRVTKGEDFAPVREMVRSPNAVARIAALAPRVISRAAKGSRADQAVVRAAQLHLADLLIDLATALRLKRPIRLSWAGSLLENQKFRAGVWRAARRSGLRIKVIPPHESPLLAAAHLALMLINKPSSSGQGHGVRVL